MTLRKLLKVLKFAWTHRRTIEVIVAVVEDARAKTAVGAATKQGQ
jgi:hypothetical protein